MSERFQIDILDFGGWVRVFLARGEPMGPTAEFLSQSLNGWMQSNPHLRVRIIVPVTSNGDTSELHAWYDQVLFPPIESPEFGQYET